MDLLIASATPTDATLAQLGRLASAVTYDFAFARPTLAALSDSLGFAPDQLGVILALLLAFPLAIVHGALPGGPNVRHAFSAGAGVAVAQFVYGTGWLHSLGTSLAVYALICARPRAAAAPTFALCMAYLSAAHLWRMRTDYMGYTLDFTGPQMLLTIKLTSLAFNVQDGALEKECAAKDGENNNNSKVLQRRAAVSLPAPPSLLQFLGYVYNFGTFMAGPAFEMREYLNGTERSHFIEVGGSGGKGKGKLPSSRLVPTLRKLLAGVAYLGLFAALGGTYDITQIVSAERLAEPWPQRFAWSWLAIHVTRWRYYGAWYLAEASCVLMGFGYVPRAAAPPAGGGLLGAWDPRWDGVSNVMATKVDFGASPKEILDNWNKATQSWLAHYVYARTGSSLAATYTVSAVWHGFYPGYYFTFLSMPLLTKVNRLCFRRVSPRFASGDGSGSSSHPVWWWACCVAATSVMLNYLIFPFLVLDRAGSLAVWGSYGYAGHALLALLVPVLSALPAPRAVGKQEEEEKKKKKKKKKKKGE